MVVAQPANEPRGVGGQSGPEEWFNSLPILTRVWFGATVMITLSVNFGILSGMQVIYSWPQITGKLELWRVLTCFCYAGPFAFPTLITIYMLVQFSKQYEAGGPFDTGAGGGTADYAFMLLLGILGTLATYPVLMSIGIMLPPIFCQNLIFMVLYVWSKRNPTANANIWGFPVQAIYLPFVYLALSVFTGSSYMDIIHGIAVGHIYYFLVDVIPVVYGRDFLRTPGFLIDQFGIGEYTPAAPTRAAAPAAGAAANNNRGGHQWGSGGQTLGTN